MKIKKIIILLELILICFLGGCTNVSGLDEQLIIYGIGVDKDNDKYELSVQALSIQNTAASDSKEEKKSVINISAKSSTLIDAINKIENETGKKVLYSHTIVLIIGEETAKSGINEIITFFSTNHKLRPTVEVLISNVPAKDIFSSENEDKIINSEDILSITNIGKENNDAIHSNIRYLLSDLNNSSKAAKVWYIEYNNGQIQCSQIALFKLDKLVDILNEDIAKGALLIYGKSKNISDNIKINNELIYYDINKTKSNINVTFEKNKPVFNINLNTELELYNADSINNNEIKSIIENRLSTLANNAINFCIKRYNCDIFNFYKYIMNTDSAFFKSNLNQIDEIINSADYKVITNVKIRYMGPNQKINSLVY